MTLVAKENIKLNLALAIPIGAPIILANEIINISPIVSDKTTKVL